MQQIDETETAYSAVEAHPTCTVHVHCVGEAQSFEPRVFKGDAFISLEINSYCSVLLSPDRLVQLRDVLNKAVGIFGLEQSAKKAA